MKPIPKSPWVKASRIRRKTSSHCHRSQHLTWLWYVVAVPLIKHKNQGGDIQTVPSIKHFEWNLTNGPLSKLLELLDTQVFWGPFSGSCWRKPAEFTLETKLQSFSTCSYLVGFDFHPPKKFKAQTFSKEDTQQGQQKKCTQRVKWWSNTSVPFWFCLQSNGNLEVHIVTFHGLELKGLNFSGLNSMIFFSPKTLGIQFLLV